MKKILVALCAFLVAGCSAIRHKQHTLFCVGACVHHEGETQKDAPPQKPAKQEKQT